MALDARVPTAPASAPARRRFDPLHAAGRLLVIAGLALMIVFAGDFGLGVWREHQLDRTFQAQVAAAPPPAHAGAPPVQPYPVDGVDFAVRVPRIDYFAAVAEGTDSGTLASGPGHYPTTAWPGQPGNVGVAAHNVYWIRFGDLVPGDLVKLETRWGTYTYRVTGKRIVSPGDRSILVPTPAPRLTLTTCWPLWAGAFAQQRLVIFADQVDPSPLAGGT